MNGLKMEKLNEGIINLAGIDIISIIIFTLVIHVLSLKMWLNIGVKYEKLTKMHSLERPNNETKKNFHRDRGV